MDDIRRIQNSVTPSDNINIHISNAIHHTGPEPDVDEVEVIFRKDEVLSGKKMKVYYSGKNGKSEPKIVPYEDGIRQFDTLADGGRVSEIIPERTKRLYTSVTLTPADFADKLAGCDWKPRTKKRGKGQDTVDAD